MKLSVFQAESRFLSIKLFVIERKMVGNGCANVPMCRYANVPMSDFSRFTKNSGENGCANARMCKYADGKMCQCANVPMSDFGGFTQISAQKVFLK